MAQVSGILLCCLAFAFLLTAALMAALVGLVLPKDFLQYYNETNKGKLNRSMLRAVPEEVIVWKNDSIYFQALNEVNAARQKYNDEFLGPMVQLCAEKGSIIYQPYYIPPDPRRRVRRDLSYVDIKQHSYLVSINRPFYVNMEENISFNCAGVAISKNLVLTSRDCAASTPKSAAIDFTTIVIRTQSNYSSIGGVTHMVARVFKSPLKHPYNQFLVLLVDPPFSNHVIPINLPFTDKNYHNGSIENLFSVGWGVTWTAEGNILKYKKVYEDHWTPDVNICKNIIDCVAVNKSLPLIECCVRGTLDSGKWLEHVASLNGRPLVNRHNYIIGMKFDYLARWLNPFHFTHNFLTFRHRPFLVWISDVMNGNQFILTDRAVLKQRYYNKLYKRELKKSIYQRVPLFSKIRIIFPNS